MNYDGQLAVYSQNGIKLSVGSKCGSITGLHAHDNEYQFEVLLSGKSRSLFKNEHELVLPGHIEIYNPAELHEIDYRGTESFIFHLQKDDFKEIFRDERARTQEPIFNNAVKKKLNIPLSFLYQEITILKNISEITHQSTTINTYKEDKVLTLLKLLLEQSEDTNKYLNTLDRSSHHKVEKARKWIQKNFYQDDINISSLAELSHLSTFHFIRVFKLIYGKTPYDYLMETRVKVAIKIL